MHITLLLLTLDITYHITNTTEYSVHANGEQMYIDCSVQY